jgi:hypothetical protein
MTALSDADRAAGLAKAAHLKERLAARDLTGPCTVPFCPNLDVSDCAAHGCAYPAGGVL